MKKKTLIIVCIIVIIIGIFAFIFLANRKDANENTINNQDNMAVNSQEEKNNTEIANNEVSNIERTNMKLKVNDKEIDIVIYDTEVGKDILSRLPYKATISNSGIDLCGDAGKDIKYSENELTTIANKGDIMYIDDGNYFSIFLMDYTTKRDCARIGKIVNVEDVDYLNDNTSTVTIEISK